jgi:hypothetical protein
MTTTPQGRRRDRRISLTHVHPPALVLVEGIKRKREASFNEYNV